MKTQPIDIIKKEELPNQIWEYIYKELQFKYEPFFTIVVERTLLENISRTIEDSVRYDQGNPQELFEIDKLINDMKSDYLIIGNL